MEKTIFYEKQQHSQSRLLYILPITLILVLGFSTSWLIKINYKGSPVELASISTFHLIVVIVIMAIISLVVIVYNSITHLKTKINLNDITVSYFTFGQKQLKIKASEILSVKIRTYNAYKEYWGYGVRDNRLRGRAYILKGTVGLQLHLKDGKKVLIGTQRKQAIEYAMGKMMKRENSNKNG